MHYIELHATRRTAGGFIPASTTHVSSALHLNIKVAMMVLSIGNLVVRRPPLFMWFAIDRNAIIVLRSPSKTSGSCHGASQAQELVRRLSWSPVAYLCPILDYFVLLCFTLLKCLLHEEEQGLLGVIGNHDLSNYSVTCLLWIGQG